MTIASVVGTSGASLKLPQAVFTDFSTLDALRSADTSAGAIEDVEGEQLKEAARQFSSIFLHMALKSMRDASFGGGILDSQQSEFYRDMFDQQLALDLSEGQGFGLTQLIVDQLSQRDVSVEQGVSPVQNEKEGGRPAQPHAAQAYSEVALATQGAQVHVGAADRRSNDHMPVVLDSAKTNTRPESDRTTRLAFP